MVTGNCYG